jgi:predicted dehydrogenase
MQMKINRRNFLTAMAAAAGAAAVGKGARVFGANSRVNLAVIGTGGRGTSLAKTFQQQPNVAVVYACDVDRSRAEKAAAAAAGSEKPRVVTDFRRILDDREIDAVAVATCNHWHAPATILACAAGKHVYVEKPCSHNPREGELMVEAARKYGRHVQMGNQRRSWPMFIEAIEVAKSGRIGRVYYAQSWYTNNRPSIGRGKPAAVPEGLDYDLWQGPAPRRPFRDNYLHYNWHWFWHWGNGELGNNGVHTIDLCRWALQVDYPIQVTSSGGRFRYSDDQETPDTNVVSFTFADGRMINWEGLSCNRMPEGRTADVILHGENGSIAIQDRAYVVYDAQGKEIPQGKDAPQGKETQRNSGSRGDAIHISNFIGAIRDGAKLNSQIAEGHKSTLLCHLGNIAYRTSHTLKCDPKNGHILGDREAASLWTREYEKGWEPKV